MTKESQKFFLILALSIIGTFSYGYYRFIYTEDYPVTVYAPCDPLTQSCFVAVCDPNEEECSGDVATDTSYYVSTRRPAYAVPDCDPNDDACQEKLPCLPEDSLCVNTYCDATVLGEGERCSDESDKALIEEAQASEQEGAATEEEGAEDTATNDEASATEETASDEGTATDETKSTGAPNIDPSAVIVQ